MKLTLADKENLLDNIWAFRFTPDEPLHWIPGQFVYVEVPHDHPDKEGPKRWFTVSSAPYENLIQITTRVTESTFKQALSKIPIGGSIELIDKPDGDFIWQETDKRRIFVAGGIGVTPFRSILRQRFHDGQDLPVTLLYGGRDENLPFKDEIETWATADPSFTVHYVIGERLNAKINELMPDNQNSLIYVSGPEPMVEALGDELRQNGLPEAQLKQDFFPNYTETNY